MNSTRIEWKIFLHSDRHKVFSYIATDEGREQFWVEHSQQEDQIITMVFPNEFKWKAEILEQKEDELLKIRYIGNSTTMFQLISEDDGTVLKLTDELPNTKYYDMVKAGWVSVLMSLKAAVDFGVDLRNHNKSRTWDMQFVNN